jgi:hypothetical protein
MSDNLYNRLVESWERMSVPVLVTESEVREALPHLAEAEVVNIRSICENYLKFEAIALSESEDVLCERFAGDDQAIVPSNAPFDPNKTLGKPEVPPAPPEKKQGFLGKAKAMAGKVKEFASKVKDIYTQLPKKKILILLAAGLVVSMIAPHAPIIGGIAKAAFGGFNVFKGGKGFWQEFNKVKGDRSNVKAVLSVLQLAAGLFSGISGAGNIVDQIANTKQQVVAAAGDATHAAPAPHDAAPAAPQAHDAAPAAADMTKYSAYGASKATELQGDIQGAMTSNNPLETFKKVVEPFAQKVGEAVHGGKLTAEQAQEMLKGFAGEIHKNNGGVPTEAILKKLLAVANIK